MNSARPPEHPDADLLADLAADVLPTHQARAVEAHVMACARCSSVLTDAEQVRNLLLSDDPGPMPPDVLARIDQALQIEAAARDGMGDHPAPTAPNPVTGQTLPPQSAPRAAPPVRVISPWEDTTTIEAFEAARKRQAAARKGVTEDRSGAGGPATTTSGIAAPRSRGPRLTRPSRGPSRSRRDMRDEVRDVKAGRRGMVLAGAAGLVIMVGLGGYVVVTLLGDHEANTATSAASSVESAPKAAGVAGGPPVVVTGTNYTGSNLKEQAKALVARIGEQGGQRAAAAPTADKVQPGAQSGAQPGLQPTALANSGDAAAAAAAVGNDALRNPGTLSGCLNALRAGGRRPVAVDLARYEGRDAAVIVLNGANGGYEVWVVARDCRPGADGTITFLDLGH